MAAQFLKCVQCGEEFVFTAGEQKFYAERDLLPPKRCKECRAVRKAAREKGDGQ
jgi:hypothetical protein